MSIVVRLEGWREGLRKVSLTRVLREAGLGLRDAKRAVDDLLDGKRVEVSTGSQEAAQRLVRDATTVGAVATAGERPEFVLELQDIFKILWAQDVEFVWEASSLVDKSFGSRNLDPTRDLEVGIGQALIARNYQELGP